MLAPSSIAWARSWSLHSRATAAAFKASQISLRPSKAGAVSQNSSLLLRSWPSVMGYSLFHLGLSFFRGSLRAGWDNTWIKTMYLMNTPPPHRSKQYHHVKHIYRVLYGRVTPLPINKIQAFSYCNMRNEQTLAIWLKQTIIYKLN